jgi:hypothetical protein
MKHLFNVAMLALGVSMAAMAHRGEVPRRADRKRRERYSNERR